MCPECPNLIVEFLDARHLGHAAFQVIVAIKELEGCQGCESNLAALKVAEDLIRELHFPKMAEALGRMIGEIAQKRRARDLAPAPQP